MRGTATEPHRHRAAARGVPARLVVVAILFGSLGCAARSGARADEAWVDAALRRMSLRDKAAQMVWPWVLGDYVAENSQSWVRTRQNVTEDKVGGVIISVGSPLEIAAKLNALQRLSDLPLVVSADLEYGPGYRARGGYFLPNGIDLGGASLFPPPMAVGATGDTALAYAMARATAVEGRALGIHIVFAPILDVNNNPANPVINTRSFGESPAEVARMGAAFVRGVQENGMIATGKHFPGHGDTEINSHLAMAVVSAPRARLDSVELAPFRAAIAAGVGAIMTFHGAMPALDSSNTVATLSPRIMTGLLRQEMRFDGLVVSDAMDMRGVLSSVGLPEACKRAVEAGVDVLLMPSDIRGCIDAVSAGVGEGRYAEARLDRSVRSILMMKRRLGLDRRRLVDLDSARVRVGDTANVAVARTIAQRSVVLVKDSLRQIPLAQLPAESRILSVTYARRAEVYAGTALDAVLRQRHPSLRSVFANSEDAGFNYASVLGLADSADAVIVSSYVSHSSSAETVAASSAFVEFVRELVRRGKRPIVVAMGSPYLLRQVPEVPAYLVAWSGFPISQQAAARALLGTAPIGGRLPIAMPPYAAIGAGERRATLSAGAH